MGTKGEKMVARRRKKNSRRSRVTNVNLTELGAGLALASAAGAPTIVAQVQKADFGAAFKTLSDAFTNKETQKKMVGIGTNENFYSGRSQLNNCVHFCKCPSSKLKRQYERTRGIHQVCASLDVLYTPNGQRYRWC